MPDKKLPPANDDADDGSILLNTHTAKPKPNQGKKGSTADPSRDPSRQPPGTSSDSDSVYG